MTSNMESKSTSEQAQQTFAQAGRQLHPQPSSAQTGLQQQSSNPQHLYARLNQQEMHSAESNSLQQMRSTLEDVKSMVQQLMSMMQQQQFEMHTIQTAQTLIQMEQFKHLLNIRDLKCQELESDEDWASASDAGSDVGSQNQEDRDSDVLWTGRVNFINDNFTPYVKILNCSILKSNVENVNLHSLIESWNLLEMELSAELFPSSILNKIDQSFLLDSDTIHIEPVFSNGQQSTMEKFLINYVGCIVFPFENTYFKAMILKFTAGGRTFEGILPRNQEAFLLKLTNVVHEEKIIQNAMMHGGVFRVKPNHHNDIDRMHIGRTPADRVPLHHSLSHLPGLLQLPYTTPMTSHYAHLPPAYQIMNPAPLHHLPSPSAHPSSMKPIQGHGEARRILYSYNPDVQQSAGSKILPSNPPIISSYVLTSTVPLKHSGVAVPPVSSASATSHGGCQQMKVNQGPFPYPIYYPSVEPYTGSTIIPLNQYGIHGAPVFVPIMPLNNSHVVTPQVSSAPATSQGGCQQMRSSAMQSIQPNSQTSISKKLATQSVDPCKQPIVKTTSQEPNKAMHTSDILRIANASLGQMNIQSNQSSASTTLVQPLVRQPSVSLQNKNQPNSLSQKVTTGLKKNTPTSLKDRKSTSYQEYVEYLQGLYQEKELRLNPLSVYKELDLLQKSMQQKLTSAQAKDPSLPSIQPNAQSTSVSKVQVVNSMLNDKKTQQSSPKQFSPAMQSQTVRLIGRDAVFAENQGQVQANKYAPGAIPKKIAAVMAAINNSKPTVKPTAVKLSQNQSSSKVLQSSVPVVTTQETQTDALAALINKNAGTQVHVMGKKNKAPSEGLKKLASVKSDLLFPPPGSSRYRTIMKSPAQIMQFWESQKQAGSASSKQVDCHVKMQEIFSTNYEQRTNESAQFLSSETVSSGDLAVPEEDALNTTFLSPDQHISFIDEIPDAAQIEDSSEEAGGKSNQIEKCNNEDFELIEY